MVTKMAPTLETVESLVAEVEQWYERVRKVRRKMNRVKLGSEAYQDLLAELWVELDWLKMKAEVAADAIDEYQESLPEDEKDTGPG
jgi:predicted  nucleic acid-binding Zn-ribbon protein